MQRGARQVEETQCSRMRLHTCIYVCMGWSPPHWLWNRDLWSPPCAAVSRISVSGGIHRIPMPSFSDVDTKNLKGSLRNSSTYLCRSEWGQLRRRRRRGWWEHMRRRQTVLPVWTESQRYRWHWLTVPRRMRHYASEWKWAGGGTLMALHQWEREGGLWSFLWKSVVRWLWSLIHFAMIYCY